MTAVRTLVVWCPDWPVTAAGVDGELVPAAVVHANRVVASSAAARREGVVRGLRRREAQGRAPDLLVLEHDPSRDARAFEPVVAAVEALSPRVEIVRPGVCALATRGPSRYFGGDDAVAERVRAAVADVGIGCQVGIADGPFAAELAARRDLVVPAGESAAFLAPFPVRVLDRPDLVDLLVRLGVRTLGALAELPPASVLGRFGPDGELAARLARGLDERPLSARTPPPDLTVQAELDPPAERVDTAAFVAKSLADALSADLVHRGLACTRIAIEAETEHGEHLVRLWRADGTLSAAAIAERVRWQLDGWIQTGATTAGISLLRLSPDQVRPDTGAQSGFWGGATEVDERAARVLARVQGLLGPDAVCTAVVGGGRSPAEQVRLVPWGDPREPDRPPEPPWPGQVPPPSPATVHDPSLPVNVLDAAGAPVLVTGRVLVSAPPARVDGEQVTAWAGPWPVDERWWDPPVHRRRARLQVVTADGSARLVVVEGGRWWVEATYD